MKKKLSFLHTARSLELEGPSDWSDRIDDYLYGSFIDSDDVNPSEQTIVLKDAGTESVIFDLDEDSLSTLEQIMKRRQINKREALFSLIFQGLLSAKLDMNRDDYDDTYGSEIENKKRA
jgi:hypothetical protein